VATILCDDNRKAISGDHFVFFSQLTESSMSVSQLEHGLRRSLGRLRDVAVRVLNLTDNQELVRSENLAPVLNGETALSLGEVYRHNGDWKFKVIGEGYSTGVAGSALDYGQWGRIPNKSRSACQQYRPTSAVSLSCSISTKDSE
jgi:tellurium resistance protein TerD